MECISEHFGANMPQAWSLSKRYHGSTSDRSNMTRCIFLAMQIQHLPFLHIEIPLCSQSFESWHYEDFEETMSCLSIFFLASMISMHPFGFMWSTHVSNRHKSLGFFCTNRHNSASRAQLKVQKLEAACRFCRSETDGFFGEFRLPKNSSSTTWVVSLKKLSPTLRMLLLIPWSPKVPVRSHKW